MKQISDNQQGISLKNGMPGCMPGSVKSLDAGQNFFSKPECSHPAAVSMQHLPVLFSLWSGRTILPKFPFRHGNIDEGSGKNGFAMFPKQSSDVVAVHMGEQNEIDALRKNAALFKFTEHPAPFSSVPCVHQNDFSVAAFQQENIHGRRNPPASG